MKVGVKNIVMLALMIGTVALAFAMKPTDTMAKTRGSMSLERVIPKAFGDWRNLEQSSGQVVNPQQTALLATLYSQILTRTYVNTRGKVIMLSIAYGENQSDGLALHYPDICYPAQGFQLNSNSKGTMKTPWGAIKVSRLETELGQRKEPLTYWSTIGNKVVQGGTERKLEQLHYGFRGQIPDGLIFRVSSITADSEAAFELQQQFVSELLATLSPDQRQFLSGI